MAKEPNEKHSLGSRMCCPIGGAIVLQLPGPSDKLEIVEDTIRISRLAANAHLAHISHMADIGHCDQSAGKAG